MADIRRIIPFFGLPAEIFPDCNTQNEVRAFDLNAISLKLGRKKNRVVSVANES
jgi:hypothetical protein